ncbi:uncharacterized protein LOC134655552 [Cydia amplana]|uniref:uncharacterized protein LOC134655552 n=1 Tax=Cydia amplana TaxID=1869771 RepID=UPI002FE5535E
MKTILALSIMVLLELVVASPLGPCGCKPVFEYCASDYTTYHSICEYKCKHPSIPFHDWYILYNGPCLSGTETTTERLTTTEWTTKLRRSTTTTEDWRTANNAIQG